MLLPVFLCLRWLYPPSTWGHCWQTLYSKSHTIGTLSSERTFQLKNCVRNPTKIRDTAKLIHKRLNFSVGKLMERNKNAASYVVWICRTQCTRIPTHMYMIVVYTHTHSPEYPQWTLSADSLQAWEAIQVFRLTGNRFWWSGSFWALDFQPTAHFLFTTVLD